jgi:hypothetical protein
MRIKHTLTEQMQVDRNTQSKQGVVYQLNGSRLMNSLVDVPNKTLGTGNIEEHRI